MKLYDNLVQWDVMKENTKLENRDQSSSASPLFVQLAQILRCLPLPVADTDNTEASLNYKWY